MLANRGLWLLGPVMLAVTCSGCHWMPRTKLVACEAQNRALVEQTKAQIGEIANLQSHNRETEEQLRYAERQLALFEDEAGLSRKQLANYERERGLLRNQLGRGGAGNLPPALSRRLSELSTRYPSLQFDAETGISKFDTDILFSTADADLSADAKRVLGEFADLLQSPEARQLKIMVVGHADDRGISKKPTRERFPTNWHLSTHRALAVTEHLQEAGIPADRMGVSGFGSHQPIASNSSDAERHLNRRVEIFVLGPETPVVGRIDSTTTVY